MKKCVVDWREDRPDTHNDVELPVWLWMYDHMGNFMCCVSGLYLRSLLGKAEWFGRSPTSGHSAPLGLYDLCLRQGWGELISFTVRIGDRLYAHRQSWTKYILHLHDTSQMQTKVLVDICRIVVYNIVK